MVHLVLANSTVALHLLRGLAKATLSQWPPTSLQHRKLAVLQLNHQCTILRQGLLAYLAQVLLLHRRILYGCRHQAVPLLEESLHVVALIYLNPPVSHLLKMRELEVTQARLKLQNHTRADCLL